MRKLLLPLVVAAFVLLPAAPAQAHAQFLKSNPAQGSTVQIAPEQVELTFSEAVTPVNNRIRIIGPDGKRADEGTPKAEGAVLRIELKDNPPRGTYLVSFRVISADSHPVPGGFTFSIGEQSATPTQEATPEENPTISWLIGVAKYVGYAGLVLLVGSAFLLALLWPARLSRRGPKLALWLGFGLVALSTIGALALQGPYTGLGFDEVMASPFGIALLVRLAVLAVAAILLRPLINGTGGIADRVLVLGLAGIGALTWPLAGHPAGSPVPPVSIVVDAIHLAGVAAWLGGLAMLALFLLRRANESELRAILPVWSRWAGVTVSAVLLAGVVAALIEVGTVTALYKTDYGRYLLIKLALVALVMGAAMLARRAVAQGRTTIGPIVKTELAIAAVVLGMTAALTQTTPARTAEAIAQTPAIGQGQIYSTTLESNLFRLQVEIDPAKQGNNLIHLYAFKPDSGEPLNVEEWKATMALPSAGLEPIDVPMLRIPPNHASGSANIPTAGDWVFRFTARTTEIDQDTVTVTVKVK